MKNVTVSMEESVADWVRVYAAQQNMSVSRFLGETLKERMEQETSYENAHRRFLEKKPMVLREHGQSYPKRDELHDR
jgi:hypothetical protein